MFDLAFWQAVRWASLVGMVICLCLFPVGFYLQRRYEASLPDQGGKPLRRRRLIWREGESPWMAVNDAPASPAKRVDTPVSTSGEPQPDTPVSSSPGIQPAPSSSGGAPPQTAPDSPARGVRLRPRGDRRVVNFYISQRLLEEFKLRCKERGASMSEILESLISDWLEANRR